MSARFRDRIDAGRKLAAQLAGYADQPDVLVLGLPRGGVPVAFEVARELRAPLDVFVVRKLGVPGHEELAMGAIASGGVRVLNEDVVHDAGIRDADIERVTRQEQRELEERERKYRGDLPLPRIEGRTVILVDDGLATGATMRAAVVALREQQPEWLVAGVPIASPDICDEFRPLVDEMVCARTPEEFRAVGLWYEDFEATADAEVRDLLMRAAEWTGQAPVAPEHGSESIREDGGDTGIA